MKISILCFYHGPKLGVGVFLDSLLEKLIPILISNKVSIQLVVNSNFLEKTKIPFAIIEECEIKEISWLNSSLKSILFNFLIYPILLRKAKIDLVVLPTNPIIGFNLQVKSLAIIHDLNEFEISNKYGVLRNFFRKKVYLERTLKKANKIVVISQFVLKQIRLNFNLGKEIITNIEVIHNGITPKNDIETIGSLSSEKFFLTVGRIDPLGKNLWLVIEAFEEWKKHPFFNEYKLYLVGAVNNSSKKEADQFLASISKNKDVKFLGFVEEQKLSHLYRSAQATLFLSKFEGFGFPLLESFSFGTKVITHSLNDVNKEIGNNFNFEIDDLNYASEQTILRLVDYLNEKNDDQLINYSKSFDWEIVAQNYSNMILSLLRK